MSSGLQYVWEYRSPSKSVQPHYQCKLCSLGRLQHDMVDHVKGWKHGFRYMVCTTDVQVCNKVLVFPATLMFTSDFHTEKGPS